MVTFLPGSFPGLQGPFGNGSFQESIVNPGRWVRQAKDPIIGWNQGNRWVVSGGSRKGLPRAPIGEWFDSGKCGIMGRQDGK